ncbi:TPA: hypothetical protein QEL08_001036 [Stenotrophomonas maltophilia]|nr:hypothetical protein [Stenotrophomonas maltophilia]HDS1583349.1 hypothetical protein [Stenotrophomonas maltophilia]
MNLISVENDMSKVIENRKSCRGARRSRFATLALGCALALSINPVSASGWPVFDLSNLLQSIEEFGLIDKQSGQDLIEFQKQAERWSATAKQYQQALVTIQAQMRAIGLPEGQALVKVDPKYMVAETCGGSGMNFSLSGLMATLGLSGDEDLKKRQQQICVNIRMMENRKYNESIDFLNDTVPSMQNALVDIFNARTRNNDQGTVQGADSESLRTANDLAVAAQKWQGRMESYDAYIEVMKTNQKLIAKTALKGDPTTRFVRDISKTAILAGALDQ